MDINLTRFYPDDMNDSLKYILGMPNFQCAGIANSLRVGGMEIERKAEAEQAAVIHWLIKLALDHPDDWRVRAGERLAEIAKRGWEDQDGR
jgi:hypothetical protein